MCHQANAPLQPSFFYRPGSEAARSHRLFTRMRGFTCAHGIFMLSVVPAVILAAPYERISGP